VNKSQLIDTLSARYEGNRKQAQHALESVLDTITREVAKGEKVAITGFGSFEKRVREARWVRNPQTGARIKAKKTAVPKFTAGAELKNVVSGAKKLPKLTLAAGSAAAKKATSPTKKAAPAKKTAAKKTAPAKKTAAKKTTAAKRTAKKS
jgi:DNA-binding protein HU-beta